MTKIDMIQCVKNSDTVIRELLKCPLARVTFKDLRLAIPYNQEGKCLVWTSSRYS